MNQITNKCFFINYKVITNFFITNIDVTKDSAIKVDSQICWDYSCETKLAFWPKFCHMVLWNKRRQFAPNSGLIGTLIGSYKNLFQFVWFLASRLPRFQVLSYKLQVTAAKRRDKALAKAAGHFDLALRYWNWGLFYLWCYIRCWVNEFKRKLVNSN